MKTELEQIRNQNAELRANYDNVAHQYFAAMEEVKRQKEKYREFMCYL